MDARLVLATDRRLGFIRKAVLEAWTRGALAASRGAPRGAPTSTWAREPGGSRPALGSRRSPASR